jgi:ssDNA-binding replication factor A large subunit
MSDLETYKRFVEIVLKECEGADENEVATEFRRYQDDFLIPPDESMRSIIRKFSPDGSEGSLSQGERWKAIEKKVERFSEIESEDRNITIEAQIVSYTPKSQMVRGEERQIAFGWIEDNPWKDSNQRERWDYTDWGGNHERLTPGSVVRLEGVSVNEWKGNKSISINQSSRVSVLKEGGPAVAVAADEPITLDEARGRDGFVNIIARLHECRDDKIVARATGKEIPIVRGRLVDSTGTMTFVSWIPFSQEPGTLLRIEGASIRRFRNNPEINFNDGTKIELYRDSKFPKLDKLEGSLMSDIASVRDGMNDVRIVLQVESWSSREFTNSEGETKIVRSGDVLDPSGKSRLTCWCDFDPEIGSFIELSSARVQSWMGSPDLVVDNIEQISILEEAPWDSINPEAHWVEVGLPELTSGGSRRGVSTRGTVVSVREDSGIIERCPECRRVLRDGSCSEHGPQRGMEDLRIRLVVDDDLANISLIMAREPSEKFLQMKMEDIALEISARGSGEFVSNIRERLLGREVEIWGRAMIDEQGAMMVCEKLELVDTDTEKYAQEIISDWGVTL